jgi:hypothetical protein
LLLGAVCIFIVSLFNFCNKLQRNIFNFVVKNAYRGNIKMDTQKYCLHLHFNSPMWNHFDLQHRDFATVFPHYLCWLVATISRNFQLQWVPLNGITVNGIIWLMG